MTVTSRNADLLARAERVMSGGAPAATSCPTAATSSSPEAAAVASGTPTAASTSTTCSAPAR